MKSGVIPAVLLVTVIAVLAPFAQGLQCYTCRSKNDDDAKKSPTSPFHEGCKTGALPDTHLKTCSKDNVLAGGKPEEVAFACLKASESDLIVRGCFHVAENSKQTDCVLKDKATKCLCYADKCNGAIAVGPSALLAAAVASMFIPWTGF